MESLPLEKNSSRTIHILGFSDEKKTFNMGRGHESEVRVNDISVSRCHAIIKYQSDGIFIEDNRSKFGTLVLLKDAHPLAKDSTAAFQIGRSVVSFTVRDTSGQAEPFVSAAHLEGEAIGMMAGLRHQLAASLSRPSEMKLKQSEEGVPAEMDEPPSVEEDSNMNAPQP